nr:MAG TPA: hypothetical protein [Bacteriophage sp.]
MYCSSTLSFCKSSILDSVESSYYGVVTSSLLSKGGISIESSDCNS